MMRFAKFLRDMRGATAAEFALVLPAALLMFFGIIDGGRYAWEMNKLEKAVQMGTRTAVVTGVVPDGLNSWDFTGATCPAGAINPGDTICAAAMPTLVCTRADAASNVTCNCNPVGCNGLGSPINVQTDANARFARILSRMRVVVNGLRDNEVSISYSGSGLGYAGDPATDDSGNALADVAPIVTVSVIRPKMRTLLLLGGQIPLPNFSYSQTLEDGEGQVSY